MQGFVPCAVGSCHRVSLDQTSFGVRSSRSWRTFVFIVGLMLFPGYALALGSAVSGTVSDPTGRPIAGASVELADGSGAFRVSAVSDSAGNFQLTAGAPGEYKLIVKAAGFQAASRGLVITAVEERYQVNVSLAIRTVESVTVTADVN